jgi:hypothetical protein
MDSPVVEVCPSKLLRLKLDFFSLVCPSSFKEVEVVNVFLVEVSGREKRFVSDRIVVVVSPTTVRAGAPKDVIAGTCKNVAGSFVVCYKIIVKGNRDVVLFPLCWWGLVWVLVIASFPITHSSMDTVYP